MNRTGKCNNISDYMYAKNYLLNVQNNSLNFTRTIPFDTRSNAKVSESSNASRRKKRALPGLFEGITMELQVVGHK